jgi:hypothetical protein
MVHSHRIVYPTRVFIPISNTVYPDIIVYPHGIVYLDMVGYPHEIVIL